VTAVGSTAVQQANVCYSWWILSALSIISWVGWIDTSRLGQFILNCQDDKDGGIANRPWDMPDVYHTFFGLCRLTLIGHMEKTGSWGEGTVFALPTGIIWKLGLYAQVISNSDSNVDNRLGMHSILKRDKVKPLK
jgi:geranylgeranyl transferase type-2 subunit beta